MLELLILWSDQEAMSIAFSKVGNKDLCSANYLTAIQQPSSKNIARHRMNFIWLPARLTIFEN